MYKINYQKDQKLQDILSITNSAREGVDMVLGHSIALGASDIHCDPTATDMHIKVRVDGLMTHIAVLPKSLTTEFISRLKVLSMVRTDIHHLPQDARWQCQYEDKKFNLRLSFMPTYHGENVVIRILPGENVLLSLGDLGFIAENRSSIESALQHTSGLILVTGPTGSGKTTTLHACLREKIREPVTIITLEDPVEYEMPGVRQIHVRHDLGLNFADSLRSTLRQDPDIIMVGEIRDRETASVAIHTALTGHLVLSTLHTNSALEAIPRLIDMGIDHYLLSAVLRLVVAERLVRTLCNYCDGVGCEYCRSIGYNGRTLIAEVLTIDQDLKNLIADRASQDTLSNYVENHGWRDMRCDGMEKVDWGVTNYREVLRVLSV